MNIENLTEQKRERRKRTNTARYRVTLGKSQPVEEEEKIKLIRAYGGCLGIRRRRRTRPAAKSFGELQASIEPEISEWGNPSQKTCDII